MKRRAILACFGLAQLAAAGEARAQVTRIFRIGILGLATTADLSGLHPNSLSTKALLNGMRKLGYRYGENFVTEPRGADGVPERFARLATELVDLHPDVIVASGPALPALKQITSSTPIVMAAASDPVIAGYVQSLAHPGGNITGFSLQSIDVTAKRLEILKELVPGPAPSMILWSGDDMQEVRAAEAAARLRGWKLLTYEIREPADLDAAIMAAKNARAGSLLVLAAGVLYPRARRVAELMADSHLPAMYELRTTVDAGGLISYGPDINDVWERSALFVDKILRGTRPADLAIEQPMKFELVINARAAKSLGLEVPQSLLLRADVVLR